MNNCNPRTPKFEGGRWVSTSNTNRMAATVVEWLNAVDNLRTFLDDPRTPLDSNAVERQLRVVTVLRKICGIKQTVEFAERFADMLSLFETADLCGIKDPVRWLDESRRLLRKR